MHEFTRKASSSALVADNDTPISEYIDLFDVAADKLSTRCPTARTLNGTVHNHCVTGDEQQRSLFHLYVCRPMARRLLVFFLENMNIFMMFIFAFLVT